MDETKPDTCLEKVLRKYYRESPLRETHAKHHGLSCPQRYPSIEVEIR